MNKNKQYGVIYTPENIVDHMINLTDIKIEDKILEPSVGVGNFIFGLLKYIRRKYHLEGENLYNWLINQVEGYDIDPQSISILKMSLYEYFLNEFGFLAHSFNNFIEGDSLFTINKKYDVVIGNPPYVRTKNIEFKYLEKIREEFISCKNGNIDLYYAFIEKFSNQSKKLCFITPNSWISNKSAQILKNEFIMDRLNLLIDFKEKQVFNDAKTYTSIILLNNKSKEYLYSNNLSESPKKIIKFNNICFNSNNKYVYSGIATLADKLFTVKFKQNNFYANYNNMDFEIEEGILGYLLKLTKIKNSLVNVDYIIYPYDQNNKLYSEEYIKNNFPKTYKYLLNIKNDLNKRDKGKVDKYENWFAYGRKQGFHNITSKNIIIIPSMIGNDCVPQLINIEGFLDKKYYLHLDLYLIMKNLELKKRLF